MCGITGFWAPNSPRSSMNALITSMTKTLQNRGPDAQSVWVDESAGLALGHRRLSILDISDLGTQPMSSSSGRYVISYNGEIYNYQELKKSLGICHFKTETDTEVLLESIEQNGLELTLSQINGMFAFILWDRRENVVSLVRDPLGIKPLYWGHQNGTFFFGSQLKSFKLHPHFVPVISSEALSLYFELGYVPAPYAIFEDFYKVMPGTVTTLQPGNPPKTQAFWSLKTIVSATNRFQESLPEDQVVDQLDHVLRSAVQRHMVSDVPLGAFLSGGKDSSLVVALMQSVTAKPVNTYTIGFDDPRYNEASIAQNTAKILGTHHHELILGASDMLKLIHSIPEWFDEPFADSSLLPTYLVSRFARHDVTVALSGDGGDELFGGYNRYVYAHMYDTILSHMPLWARSLMRSTLKTLEKTSRLKTLLGQASHLAYIDEKIPKIIQALEAVDQESLYKGFVTHGSARRFSSLNHPILDFPSIDSTFNGPERMQYWDLLTYLPDDILVKLDRCSMAVGLEARVPFLDKEVVEYSWQIPSHLKIKSGDSKYILKKVLEKYLPSTVINQPKRGFSVPLHDWLKTELQPWIQDTLNPESLSHDFFNVPLVSNAVESFYKDGRRCHIELWNLAIFQQWYKSFNS